MEHRNTIFFPDIQLYTYKDYSLDGGGDIELPSIQFLMQLETSFCYNESNAYNVYDPGYLPKLARASFLIDHLILEAKFSSNSNKNG